VVYFLTSPEQCFCTSLQNRQTQTLHIACIAGLFFVEPGLNVNFYHSKCYLLSYTLRVTISSFSRKAHLCIGRMTQSNSCSVKHLISFLQSYGPQQYGPQPQWLQDLGSHARCRSTISINSSSDWLTFGEVCSKMLSTLLSASGDSICRRVFVWREDTSKICCRLFW